MPYLSFSIGMTISVVAFFVIVVTIIMVIIQRGEVGKQIKSEMENRKKKLELDKMELDRQQQNEQEQQSTTCPYCGTVYKGKTCPSCGAGKKQTKNKG